jgi:flagellar L-ring protein precursor FlgH
LKEIRAMLKRAICIFVMILGITRPVMSQLALWEDGRGSLYSNLKAYKVGDVVTVIIKEESSASSNSKTDTKIKSEMSSGPGMGTLDFISLWGLDSENKYKGDAKTQRSGQLIARISVRIVEILPSGDYRIEGQREVNINGERERIAISGIIRSRDIRPDNTIISTNVANAKIMYDGKGFNWIL